MDAREFVFMCGFIASHHDTALAHAMLHAVAVWADARGVARDTLGVSGHTRPHPDGTRGFK